ncbi:hypothetical protein HK407_09g15440 [Ordospora pajunii]|uniref:uncharacterized protein n=1 Tax=Ordospora pajunii TaxID=3039483 RepID=UPI0029528F68|nr:uncharacterized protein HK407_09g15440 [Ordospora pajunii]KAH9410858.1 hypothetical protein HK407_09g15440 [Ordospora pajunii]
MHGEYMTSRTKDVDVCANKIFFGFVTHMATALSVPTCGYAEDMKPLAILVIRLFEWIRVTLDHMKNPINIPMHVPLINRQYMADIYNEKGAEECFLNHVLKVGCVEEARKVILSTSKRMDKVNFIFVTAIYKANKGCMNADIGKYAEILTLFDTYMSNIEQSCYSQYEYNLNYRLMYDLISDLKRKFCNSMQSNLKTNIKVALSNVNIVFAKGEFDLERLISIAPYSERFYLVNRNDFENNLYNVSYKIVTDIINFSPWNNHMPDSRFPLLRLYLIVSLLKYATYY